MTGYTVCKKCLRTVKVTDGKLAYHVPGSWSNTCDGAKTDALWIDTCELNASGRDTDGFCMRCNQHIKHGPNLDCQQCCYERRNDCLSYAQKVQATIDRLSVKGARVTTRRRKLANRTKTYLRIRAGGTHTTFFSLALPLIHKDFPEAYMTSGGFMSRIAEPTMDITVSLDPRSN